MNAANKTYLIGIIIVANICFRAFCADTNTGAFFTAKITIKSSTIIGEVRPIWRFFGYDEPNYTYMPEGSQLLDEIKKLNPQPVFIRTHHLLTSGDGTAWLKWGSTGAYDEDKNQQPIYNWTILDKIFDSYIHRNLKPLVEIGFMPKALSVKPEPYTNPVVTNGPPVEAVGRGWAYPPKDYAKWAGLIENWVKHCISRYGPAEVESWLWELWNEPNIAYWRGTQQEYHKLYDYTATTIKRILPSARVGGPHTAGTQGGAEKFLRAFIEHCLRGTNHLTGKVGTPIDFIAFHAKGGTEFINGYVRMNLGNHLRIIDNGFRIVKSYPEIADLPVIIGESDPDGCAACSAQFFPQNSYRNGAQYASYTAATFMRKLELARRHKINFLGAVTWAFEFEDQPYFAGFRVLSTRGILLPVFNTFKLFSMLGDRQVEVVNPTAPGLDTLMKRSVRGDEPDVDAFATRGTSGVYILVWHYYDSGAPGSEAVVELEIDELKSPNGKARLKHYRIDNNHSNGYTEWLRLGSPQNPTPEQLSRIKKASELSLLEPEKTVDISAGKLKLSFSMPRQSVSLIAVEW